MKLSRKLFLSHLLVVLIGLAVLAVSTAYVAPISFAQQMGYMGGGAGIGGVNGAGAGAGGAGAGANGAGQRGMGGMSDDRQAELNAQVETNFRTAIDYALLRASIAAVVATVVVTWLVSQQIVNPLRALVKLSQRIAGGHYQERLEAKSHDELADLVHSFNQMAEALDHTETLRHELLADVTHELKTPLASIKGYMEGLQDGVIPANDETFHLIYHEAARLQRLVQDLQELSRAEAGEEPIHPQTIDPRSLVETAVERIRPQFVDQEIALTTELPASLPAVYADSDRVGQVLVNLLGNALQATPGGGHVEVSLTSADDQVQFAVRDSGIGIAPENLDRIFQRFYRVDKSRSRSSGGSGIGLTISRHLIEAHGGQLWAESDGLGKGSVFHFSLPTSKTLPKLHTSDIPA